MATARLAGLSPEIGFFAFLAGSLAFAIFGDSRFLSCGADSTITPIFAGGLAPVEFAIREQTGIGRDDGSTKLKHQSAVEIESENLAVRFTPFWPKLRLSMSIGKRASIQEIGGLRTSAMGLTAPELCPAGPSRRSTFTRIQIRVAMHAMCLLPSCGGHAEGLSATTFDAQISTFVGLG